MKRNFNQLYDDFFSSPSLNNKKEEVEKKEILEDKRIYPTLPRRLENYVLGQQMALKKLDLAMQKPSLLDCPFTSILVCGPKGSGKHTLLKRFHEHLYVQSYLSTKHPTFIHLDKIHDEMTLIQDIYSALQTDHQMIVFENIHRCDMQLRTLIMDLCEDGVLPLKQRYSIHQDKLVLSTTQLEKKLISELKAHHHYFVFLIDGSLSQTQQQLPNQFTSFMQDIIETQPLPKESLVQLITKDVEVLKQNIQERFQVTLSITDTFKQQVLSYYTTENGYHGIKKFIHQLHQEMVDILLINQQPSYQLDYQERNFLLNNIPILQKEDNQDVLSSIQKEIDEMIGLDKVKEYIYSLRDFIQISKRRKAQGLKTDEVSMHMIFTGNPGTGKTTVARLIAKYFKALGILKNGQLLEVTRADLVASYVGQTAPKTKQIIESSLGGILFIDEAYSLYRGKEDSFGLEAIDMLVKEMEDHRDDLVVILAGYTKEMQVFLEANSGLKSRFANIIEFPDYTGEQLLSIAMSQAKAKDYQIEKEAQTKLLDYFNDMQSLQDKRSGNGRLARNVVEDAILKQASRLAHDLDSPLDLLITKDFILDTNEK